MDQRIDVLGLGSAAIDDILYVDTYPLPDTKIRVARWERRCGGLTGTALVAAARPGDVFHGAYAAGLASGMDLIQRLRLASASAALYASRSGEHRIPRREDVRTFRETAELESMPT